ncbi:MAG: N-(5'-phosphoribosyl)anthranilate isomerase [Micavibrio sp.]|nr:MAG: N-(5'-phosphoribosyl)anthranilate isomerase [Micavibrio sp.]
MTKVKICGLTQAETMQAAIEAGADYLGFVFYPASKRYIDPETCAKLIQDIPDTATTVGLFVDPDDELLESVLNRVKINMVQLHGDETPQRASEIKAKFALPIIKAIRIASQEDLASVKDYQGIIDAIMFDTKLSDSPLPGGTGQSFDWGLLENYDPTMTWFLAGGLTPENVSHALSILTPDVVDVSSGVENAPGQKDENKIRDFIKAVQSHDQSQ